MNLSKGQVIFLMKALKLFLLMFIFISSTVYVSADEESGIPGLKIPSGMELRQVGGHAAIVPKNAVMEEPAGMEKMKIGGVNLLVPKGTQITKKGTLLIVESRGEYAARRFLEMEERFEQLEAEQEKLKKTIVELENIIKGTKAILKE